MATSLNTLFPLYTSNCRINLSNHYCLPTCFTTYNFRIHFKLTTFFCLLFRIRSAYFKNHRRIYALMSFLSTTVALCGNGPFPQCHQPKLQPCPRQAPRSSQPPWPSGDDQASAAQSGGLTGLAVM
ncbi:hypothetical protein FVE88_18800 [Ectopseudomonas mendocina]|nr:hypothetical protein FVE88_18800 [Pseudomonas mendocina]